MELKENFAVYSAPIQGLTELPWRAFHRQVYGDAVSAYHTPFLRVERSEVRPRDLKALESEMNEGTPLVPQIIFRDLKEFAMLVESVRNAGYTTIDMNMGCPFPPQVHHGRGAGMMANRELLSALPEVMRERYPEVEFSLKMRLGVESPDEWRGSMDQINALPLKRLTVHPRTARQQYGGELHLDEFGALLAASAHPVVYNGDIVTPADIDRVAGEFTGLAGVMVGRGLFSRPSLVAEWREGREWDERERARRMLELHGLLYDYYTDRVSGDGQLMGKLKPFWDYLEGVDRRTLKMMKKAVTLRKYDEAVAAIERDLLG
ncbi:MAG: tRNA-dihydrouridine synthase family protein [Duncaniella sp.]|nr:tRNA-dihydrouridine synthase family protein [Duncaniella sp.]